MITKEHEQLFQGLESSSQQSDKDRWQDAGLATFVPESIAIPDLSAPTTSLPTPPNFDHKSHITVTQQLTQQVQSLNITDQSSLETAIFVRTNLIQPALEKIRSIFGYIKPKRTKKDVSEDERYIGILGGERKILDLAKENIKKTTTQVENLSRPYLEAQEYIDEQIKEYDLENTLLQQKVYQETSDEIKLKSKERILSKVEELHNEGKDTEADKLYLTLESFQNPMPEFQPLRLDTSGSSGSSGGSNDSSASTASVVIARVKTFTVLDVNLLDEEYLKPRVADMVKIKKLVTKHGVDAERMVTLLSEEIRSDPVEMKSRLLAIKVQVDQPQIRNKK